MMNDKEALTIEVASNLLPGSVFLVDGLLFAPISREGLRCDLINENLVIIALIDSGKIQFKINGTNYEVSQNEIFALHPGDIIERFDNDAGATGYFFVCSVNRTIELVRDIDFYRISLSIKTSPVIRLSNDHFGNIINCARMIDGITSLQNNNTFSSLTCLHLTEAITCEIYEGLKGKEMTEGNKMSRSEIIFRDFLTMLSSMPLHQRSVEWYAHKLCISSKYLSETCRKCSGRCASEWIKDYIMFDIRSHLKNSSKSIKEVAHRLGFSSLTFFGKCVRRWFGQSPTELREQLRNKHPRKIDN